MKRAAGILISVFLLLGNPFWGVAQEDSHKGHQMEMTPENGDEDLPMDHSNHIMPDQESADIVSRVKVVEKLGDTIPMELTFQDENGQMVELSTFFDKPVVILPIYFFCPTVCSYLLSDLADVINTVDPLPGRDYNVIALSFSDDETFQDAKDAKKNYTKLLTREFDHENWAFLTGDARSIRQLTDHLGFYFVKKKKHIYVHPNVLVVLSKEGMITRYVYGPDFLPFDVGMALTEAEKGQTGISIKKGVMSFCFQYDPQKKTYVFNLFRVAGTVILGFILILVLVLVFVPKRSKKDMKQPRET